MLTKITITLQQDGKDDSAMAQTLGLLAGLGILPTRKIVLALECEPEDADTVTADIKAALVSRPGGIRATIKTVDEEDVSVERVVVATPMDRAGWN